MEIASKSNECKMKLKVNNWLTNDGENVANRLTYN